jgi:hypothetical protein
MLRYLRIAVTVLCLAACVLLIALWVRSYKSEDRAQGHVNSVGIRFYSSRGWIVCFKNNAFGPGQYPWSLDLGGDYWLAANDGRLGFTSPVAFFSGTATSNISAPHWIVIFIVTLIAAVPWLPWRFSLRTLLIAMTLVAVGLGLIAAAT